MRASSPHRQSFRRVLAGSRPSVELEVGPVSLHRKAAGKGGWSRRRGQRQRRAERTTEARRQGRMHSAVVREQTGRGSGQEAGEK